MAIEQVQAADQLGQGRRLAFARGRGRFLDGAGGGGVGAQVDHPGTRDAPRGMRQDRYACPPGGGARGRRHGHVFRVGWRRVDDQQQVRRMLADRPPDPLAELGSRLAAQAAIGKAGHRRPGRFPGRWPPAAAPRAGLPRAAHTRWSSAGRPRRGLGTAAPGRPRRARKAYSRPPRSADSWPGRASTSRTLPARGSHPAGRPGVATAALRQWQSSSVFFQGRAVGAADGARMDLPVRGRRDRGRGLRCAGRGKLTRSCEARRISSLTYRTPWHWPANRAVRILPGRGPRAAVTSLPGGGLPGGWVGSAGRAVVLADVQLQERPGCEPEARTADRPGSSCWLMSSSLSLPGKPVAVEEQGRSLCSPDGHAESGGHRSHRRTC